jgi:zinc transport system substrate-binding protein
MKYGFLLLWVAIVLPFTPATQAKPLVLSSLKPLTLIAQEITGSAAAVDSLLPATASHHNYPLKMSDHARLQQADVILWVGPELESFLQKPLANLPSAKIITAYDLANMNWPAESAGAHGHHHAHDPHLWLDPRNAILVAQALTAKLAQVDAANAAQYRANLALFVAKATSGFVKAFSGCRVCGVSRRIRSLCRPLWIETTGLCDFYTRTKAGRKAHAPVA